MLLYKTLNVTNLKTIAICSLFDASLDSSTKIQNFASLTSSQIFFLTLFARICKISFWIIGEVYFVFFEAFSKTTSSMSTFNLPISLIISKKLPRLLEAEDSSWPLNAHACKLSYQTFLIIVVSLNWFFWTSSTFYAFNTLSISLLTFIKSSADFTALLCGKVGLLISIKSAHLTPSLTIFQLLKPSVVNVT